MVAPLTEPNAGQKQVPADTDGARRARERYGCGSSGWTPIRFQKLTPSPIESRDPGEHRWPWQKTVARRIHLKDIIKGSIRERFAEWASAPSYSPAITR